jgi:hypothetical protein
LLKNSSMEIFIFILNKGTRCMPLYDRDANAGKNKVFDVIEERNKKRVL